MASNAAPIAAPTVLQAANTLSGNGTSVDLTGALRAFLVFTSIAGTAGVYTFEISNDGGDNWVAANAVRDAAGGDSGAIVASTPAGAPLAVYKIDQLNGPVKFRARISTNWVTNAPAVTCYTVGK